MTKPSTLPTETFPPIPPKPPDKSQSDMEEDRTPLIPPLSSQPLSYKDVVLEKEENLEASYLHEMDRETHMKDQLESPADLDTITLTPEEKERLYQPWKYSVIVKVFGKRLSHQYLKGKLTDLWNIDEPLNLIDLGFDFYVARFKEEQSLQTVLYEGPWFVEGQFLSIKRWEPNFVPAESKIDTAAIWIRLPQLPTKFYDQRILEKVGRRIGQLVKADACPSATLRGRYVRICVEISLDVPVRTSIMIGSHKQQLLYEGEGIMCVGCGRIGHTIDNCTYITPKTTTTEA
ncbi:uncharacterized protein LOC132044560 [Lycium ferocissimum]|uniref:uncharacterized protein LOC132044560 n=1 Tax=Lycium ferocissimum TaxID=112874 RepID=UPI002815A8CF|nr:uncharacterized protein LOC132044560 [Lycium ferocissimum]